MELELDRLYREYKGLLFSIAYRMLGTVVDAEDIVQETFAAIAVKAQDGARSNPGEGVSLLQVAAGAAQGGALSGVQYWKAYLCKAVTNRCMDVLKSARRKRENYVGPWLPEPLVQRVVEEGDSPFPDPGDTAILEETVSYAMMVLLQRLTPLERAVFILREAFDYSYRDIAEIIGKTELGCRQTYSRVRRKVQAEPDAAGTELAASRALVVRFLEAARTGNVSSLIAMLREDAVLISDGGGKRLAALKPIVGSARIAAFLAGLAAKSAPTGVRLALINNAVGLILDASDGPTVVSLAPATDGRCARIYFIRNPDKLMTLQR